MIEVSIMKATRNVSFGKNATFLEGELYFARLSKHEDYFVMRSEEGYWIKIHTFEGYGYCIWNFKPENFERKALIYMRNRKRLNEFISVQDYLCGYNCKKQWYVTHIDNKLYE